MEMQENSSERFAGSETGAKKEEAITDTDINAMVTGASEAISAGIVSMTSAHSQGLLFAQGVGNQQANFQIAMAKTAKANADLLRKRGKMKGSRLELKNELVASLIKAGLNGE